MFRKLFFILCFIASGWLLTFWQGKPLLNIDPATRFVTIKGESFTVAERSEKPLLINFWASDCRGCIEEIPDMIGLYERFHAAGFNIVAVAMDYDPPNRVVAAAEAHKIPYHVALDPQAELANHFGNIRLTPTSFLLDHGKVVWHQQGRFDAQQLSDQLASLISGKTTTVN